MSSETKIEAEKAPKITGIKLELAFANGAVVPLSSEGYEIEHCDFQMSCPPVDLPSDGPYVKRGPGPEVSWNLDMRMRGPLAAPPKRARKPKQTHHQRIAVALNIFAALDPKGAVTAEHDQIWTGHDHPAESLSVEHRKALKAAGWDWDDDVSAWTCTNF